MPERNHPILPYVFYDLEQKGKTWRVLLQVNEGFVRLDKDTTGILQENLFPTIIKFLSNAGRFPEINRVSLLDDSNSFAVRLNLTWAYDKGSAEETVQSIAEKLNAYIEHGDIQTSQSPTFLYGLQEALNELDRNKQLENAIYNAPDTFEEVEEEEVPESAFSSFAGFLKSWEDEDEDDNDDNNGGINGLPILVR